MLVVKRVYVSQDIEHNSVNKAPSLPSGRDTGMSGSGSNCMPVTQTVRCRPCRHTLCTAVPWRLLWEGRI